MLSTSDQDALTISRWQICQRQLIESLRSQPLLVVLRPDLADLTPRHLDRSGFVCLVDRLANAGVRHLEIAWTPHPRWGELITSLRQSYPDLHLGVASVTSADALQAVIDLGVSYAMSPCFDPILLEMAQRHDQLLVPGVFSPSEFQQAMSRGCELVKLFPASVVGCDYLRQLSAPLDPLPLVIAAGGLGVADLDPWLLSGCHAVALGRGIMRRHSLDQALLSWLK